MINTYYHWSLDKLNVDKLIPRIPKNVLYQEDKVIPRICVSKSILGALFGSWLLIRAKERKTNIAYLYKIECTPEKVIQPRKFEVPDVDFSGEEWILEPVDYKLHSIFKLNFLKYKVEFFACNENMVVDDKGLYMSYNFFVGDVV